ncbi:MAG: DegT/DnrJ/EryC1/StrS family aminotransferase [Thermoanaerobaculales bacterium]|jgi:dTDP-4-amino-4,6-dideoxygalactose transaminase|nr:DegT/DnrJ/EryC1/StrS family aminotransferase [Thermoanaerobaculales bacterium]
MPIPLLDLKRQYEPIREEVERKLAEVAASQYFILGPEVESFEKEAASWLGVEHAVGVASGTDALLVALMALDIGPGDEVVLPTFTFFATAGVVARLGATPVFVDIEPADFNIDPSVIADRLTDRTKAVIPVHLFGQSADVAAILEAAGEVPVIEDCAQSWGSDFAGRYTGGHGVMGAFSFFPSKNLGGFGDGGLVTTRDAELAATLKQLRVHGQSGAYLHPRVGGNFRLDALQAAVLRVKLPHVQRWIQGRRANAMRYVDRFTQAGLDKVLGLPAALPGRGHTFNQLVIRAPRRDELRQHLVERGIGCAVYYPLPLHLQPCFAALGHREGDFPVAEAASREVIALPVFPELTEDEIGQVVGAIAEFYGR